MYDLETIRELIGNLCSIGIYAFVWFLAASFITYVGLPTQSKPTQSRSTDRDRVGGDIEIRLRVNAATDLPVNFPVLRSSSNSSSNSDPISRDVELVEVEEKGKGEKKEKEEKDKEKEKDLNRQIRETRFQQMTVVKLKQLAKDKGLSKYSRLNKSELIQLIQEVE